MFEASLGFMLPVSKQTKAKRHMLRYTLISCERKEMKLK